MNNQVTKQEVFEIVDKANHEVLFAISEFSTKTDQRFGRIEDGLTNVKSDIVGIKSEIVNINSEITNIKSTLNTQVVTKDYLDQKISEVRGDFTNMLRKENDKVVVLTNKLSEQKVLPAPDVQEVLSMEPFPRIS